MATTITIPVKYRSTQRSVEYNTKDKVLSNFSLQDSETLLGNDSTTRTANPDWKQVIARGGNATNPYDKKGWDFTTASISGRAREPAFGGGFWEETNVYNGFTGSILTPEDTDDAFLQDRALLRIKQRLSAHRGDIQGVVPIVELKDLRRSIIGIADLTTSVFHDLITIKKTKGRSALKWASNAWLSFSFGVKPLMNDVSDMATSIQDYMDRKDHRTRLTGKANKKWMSQGFTGGITGMRASPMKCYTEKYHTLSYKYIGAFDIAVESANNYGIAKHLHFGFESLPSVAWELLPYSWAVDYFSTVGAFLDDTFVIPDGSLKYLVLDRKYTMDANIYHTHGPKTSGATLSEVVRPGKVSYWHFSRTSLSSLPYVGLRFKTMDRVGKNALNKVLNLGAVLIQGLPRW